MDIYRIEEIFRDVSIYGHPENIEAVRAESLWQIYAFKPDRLVAHWNEIIEMLRIFKPKNEEAAISIDRMKKLFPPSDYSYDLYEMIDVVNKILALGNGIGFVRYALSIDVRHSIYSDDPWKLPPCIQIEIPGNVHIV